MHDEKGFIYILTNPATPGYIKIGRTSGNVYDEMRQLNSSVPIAFELHSVVEVYQCRMIEIAMHQLLLAKGAGNFYCADPQATFKQVVKMARENNAYLVMQGEQNQTQDSTR